MGFFKKLYSCVLTLISSPQLGKEEVYHGVQDFYIQGVALKYHINTNKQTPYAEHEYDMAFMSSGCSSHRLYNSCSKISF